MDFGIRELLIIVGLLIFVGILFDGVRRFQHNRKHQIKLDVDPRTDAKSDDIDWYSGELPNGGARLNNQKNQYGEPVDILMEGYQAPGSQQTNTQSSSTSPAQADQLAEQSHSPAGEGLDNRLEGAHEQRMSVNAGEVELEDSYGAGNSRDGQRIAPSFERDGAYEDLAATRKIEQSASLDQDADALSTQRDVQNSESDSSNRNASLKEISSSVSNSAKDQGDLFSDRQVQSQNTMAGESSLKDLPEEIIAINIIAKGDNDISGNVLMQSALSFGLRFGEMSIFHRHEDSNGSGAVVFSMANAINPGIFDIDTMPESTTKGVTLFMRLSQVKKRLFVLELMLDIAKRLANQVGAELKDDTHSVLSSQTVSHYKTRIQEYERKHVLSTES